MKQNTEIDPHIYGQLVFVKKGKGNLVEKR